MHGNRLDGNLDPEIAARHHDAVGGGDDRIELVERLVLLYFGDDRYAFVPFGDKRLGAFYVFSGTHEGKRDVIHASVESELQELKVPLGNRCDV